MPDQSKKVPFLVYIAGPYRAATPFEREENIFAARRYGAMLAKQGFFPVIPHANTANFDGIQPDTFWLDGTLELMFRCDAVYMMPNWRNSTGATEERRQAQEAHIPVCETMSELAEVLRERDQAIALAEEMSKTPQAIEKAREVLRNILAAVQEAEDVENFGFEVPVDKKDIQ